MTDCDHLIACEDPATCGQLVAHAQDRRDGAAMRRLAAAVDAHCEERHSVTVERGVSILDRDAWFVDVNHETGDAVGPMWEDFHCADTIAEAADACRDMLERG